MKRDFRTPKNMGIFEANFAKKKYPQSKASKSQVRQGFLKQKNTRNCVRESSLHGAVRKFAHNGEKSDDKLDTTARTKIYH